MGNAFALLSVPSHSEDSFSYQVLEKETKQNKTFGYMNQDWSCCRLGGKKIKSKGALSQYRVHCSARIDVGSGDVSNPCYHSGDSLTRDNH